MKEVVHQYADSFMYKIPSREDRVVNMSLNTYYTGKAVFPLNKNIDNQALLDAHHNKNMVYTVPILVTVYSDGSIEVETI